MKKNILWIALAVLVLSFSPALFAQELKRFVISVGVNDGGEKRVKLRYAVSDAKAIAKVFQEIGGANSGNVLVLEEPNAGKLIWEIMEMSKKIQAEKDKSSRVELLFYYSGHSDEQGLLLGKDRLDYKDLRDMIQKVPADIRISVLDSCSSGAITRLKGGKKQSPFLLDSAMKMKGYAFITSSSHDEASQESDKIKGSYFTHYFISGLRGAADATQKGRVTLNESYQFAFYETLQRTEKSLNAQHPGYEIEMVGSGDVVLTDLKQAGAILGFADDIEGRVSVRDSNGNFIAELQKGRGKPILLGLDQGNYEVLISSNNKLYSAQVKLNTDKKVISFADFKPVFLADGGSIRKGDDEYLDIPFSFAILPSISTGYADGKKVKHSISVNLLADYSDKLHGIAFGMVNLVGEEFRGLAQGYIANIVDGKGLGLELSGLFNINGGDFQGVQTAGIFNKNGADAKGVQLAGVINLNSGNLKGAQISVVNQTESLNGAQIGVVNISGKTGGAQIGVVNISDDADFSFGLINIVKNGRMDLNLWVDENKFAYAGLKMGSRYFYTMPFAGIADDGSFSWGFSMGTRVSFLKILFLEPEVFYQSFYKLNTKAQDVGYGGSHIDYKMGNWLGARLNAGVNVFGPLSVIGSVFLPMYYTGPKFGRVESFRDLKWNNDKITQWAQFQVGIQYSFF